MVSICFRAAVFIVSITSAGHASRLIVSSDTFEDIEDAEYFSGGRRDSSIADARMNSVKEPMNSIKSQSVSFVDEACSDPIAQTCNGICFRVPTEKYFHDCLTDSWAIATKMMKKPVVSTKPCHDLKLVPMRVLSVHHPTRDACYGGSGSQVGLWTNDIDWFWKASDAAFGGNGFDENDCAEWMERMFKEKKECLPEGFVPQKRDAEGNYEPVFDTKQRSGKGNSFLKESMLVKQRSGKGGGAKQGDANGGKASAPATQAHA